MAVLTKLMIVQWSGELPDWTERWLENTIRVSSAGYGWDFLLEASEPLIRERIESLGITCPRLEGRKLCDYRPALGEMYADEVSGYDFWGHTDLDCVYGPLWDYVTDTLLEDTDVYSNDPEPDMCGPFSLYRTETASHAFREHPGWERIMESPRHYGFDEIGIGETLHKTGLRMTHRHFEGEDSMYVHFHDKVYPDVWEWPWGEPAEYTATEEVA